MMVIAAQVAALMLATAAEAAPIAQAAAAEAALTAAMVEMIAGAAQVQQMCQKLPPLPREWMMHCWATLCGRAAWWAFNQRHCWMRMPQA